MNTGVDGDGFVDTNAEEANVSKDVFVERDETIAEDGELVQKKVGGRTSQAQG